MLHLSSSSETAELPKLENVLSLTKAHLRYKIALAQTECQKCFMQYFQKRSSFVALVRETNKFIGLIKKMTQCWNKHTAGEIPQEGRDMCTTILDEQYVVIEKFGEIMGKIKAENESQRDFFRNTQAIHFSLKQILDRVKSSRSMDQLLNVSVPTLEELNLPTCNDNMKTLTKEWKELQLLSRLEYLYGQQRLFVYPSKILYIDVHDEKHDFV